MPKLAKSDPASVGVNDTYLNQDLNKFKNHFKKVLDYHIQNKSGLNRVKIFTLKKSN